MLPRGLDLVVLLVFVEDHAAEEDKYQVFLHHRSNSRIQGADSVMKHNENQLTDFVLYKFDKRRGEVGIVFVWRENKHRRC